MHLLDELINNQKKYNDLIKNHNTSIPKNSNAVTLLSTSLLLSGIALNIDYIFSIEKNTRTTFLKKCLYVNRYSFGLLLKKGRQSYEKELIADGFEPNTISIETEIEHINSFLNNSNFNASIPEINKIVSRGIVHMFNSITEVDFKGAIHDGLSLEYDIELNYDAIRNEVQKYLHHFDLSLESQRTKQCLLYFQCASPVGDIDYQCFYKPFFMALHDYSNYLQTKSVDILEEDNTVDFFEAIENDFRKGYSGRISYDDIVCKKEFKYMEELLFEDGIIDAEYNFIEVRGNKKALAATIKFMIDEKYFRKSNYKHSRNFEFHHYRQYLDHRYGTSTNETMKKMPDNEVKLYFQSKRWKYDLNKLVNTDFYSLNTL